MQHIHILGICGTFMGGIAILAKQHGYRVSGSDANVYPPMSTQLEEQGITLMSGYHPEHLDPKPDCVVIGNALSRGNPAVEFILNQGIPYTSGPQWLFEHLLRDRWVLAAAGTHGKTSTSSILAWLLEYAGMNPGFLIGGVPGNFHVSARSGDVPFFVVEADEYDSAFFDKRSKFVHYHPRTLIMNNMEFDHADIFQSIKDIQRQFHHLVRTVPGNGLIIAPSQDRYIRETLDMGCWTPVESCGIGHAEDYWQAEPVAADGSHFRVLCQGKTVGEVRWQMTGEHNMLNALSAVAAARHAGIIPEQAVEALGQFKGIKRRMELKGHPGGVYVYDDFAHHPTAIDMTLAGLRAQKGKARIIAVFEPRSNTMRMGVHKDTLAPSFKQADEVIWYQAPDVDWDLAGTAKGGPVPIDVVTDIDTIVASLVDRCRSGDQVVIMSNGGFGGIHAKLIAALEAKHGKQPA